MAAAEVAEVAAWPTTTTTGAPVEASAAAAAAGAQTAVGFGAL